MTAPLHERLATLAKETRLDAADMGGRGRHVRCRELLDQAAMLDEAAAALRPPEGEVGALCEHLAAWERLLREEEDQFTDASALRAALAHLRRLAAVEAALREVEALANDHRDGWLETRHTGDDEQYRLALDEGLKWEAIGALARALAPAPAAEPEP